MSRATLLPLLRHYDDAVVAQAIELACALRPAERLSLSEALLSQTWRPGDPWLALRLCNVAGECVQRALISDVDLRSRPACP